MENWNPEKSATQKAQVRAYLKEGNYITPLGALRMFGCFRLSAIIFLLREEGFDIITERVKVSPKKYVAKYYINPEKIR